MKYLYCFNLGFLAKKCLLTCETIKYESPLTCRDLMFMSMTRFIPKMRASYSAMLFVQLNSSLYENRVVSFSGDLNIIIAPKPELECTPSKSKPQYASFFSSSRKRSFPK
jgi:hypothetical protein